MIQGTVVLIVCLVAGFRFDRTVFLPLALVFMFLIALLFTAHRNIDWLGSAGYAGTFPLVNELFGDAAILFFQMPFSPFKGCRRHCK